MKFKDYYQILGVSDSASQEDIKRAYRKQARKYHPDVSKEPDAEEQFKSVNEAYEVLRDESRRAEFDQIKKYGYRGGDEFRPPPGWQSTRNGHPGAGTADFSEFFESIFSSGRGANGGFEDLFRHPSQSRSQPHTQTGGRHSQGDDVHLTVRVSLLNAYRGGKTKITIPAAVGYPAKTLNVTIPAGVTEGQQMRLRGQGRPGAKNGDLLLTIRLKPHELFDTDGVNVSLTVPVTPLEALEGAKLQVPTLGGMVSITVPAGTHSGTRLRIKGRGLPATPAGDQFVIIQIAVPDSLDNKMMDRLREIESDWGFDPRAHFTATESAD